MCAFKTLLHEALAVPKDLAGPVLLGLQHLEQLPTSREERLELLRLRIREGAHGRPKQHRQSARECLRRSDPSSRAGL